MAVIECRNVTKSIGGQRLLDGLSCVFPSGEISALVGPSGAGKTLLLRHVLALVKPDSGRILVNRTDVNRLDEPELQRLRLDIGVLFQGPPALFSWLSVYDNVAFQLRHVHNLREPELRRRVMPLLEEMGLAEDADKLPEQLSPGMRSRAGCARAWALAPRTLLLDSPEEGLDKVRLELLRKRILQHQRDHAETTVVVTQDLGLMFRLATHVVVLNRGRVVLETDAASVRRSRDPFVRQFVRGLRQGPLAMA